ncbi:MAG: transcriptional regulator, tetr family protein [Ilumatobacteraceae bacterium]|nr:transcriptional regulator, tetr family protein [Ilumatobacteraceae bacterium]
MTSTASAPTASTPTGPASRFDRAAAVRHALRELVAEHGLHGTSMSAVAKRAGVATGTAYVHYASKEQLLYAAYMEVKHEMAVALQGRIDPSATPHDRFLQIWMAIHHFHAADPARARFVVQIDSSPYARRAHELAMDLDGDPLMAEVAAPDMMALMAPLDLEILYDLGIGPAVRLAAGMVPGSAPVDQHTLDLVAEACWRASTIG